MSGRHFRRLTAGLLASAVTVVLLATIATASHVTDQNCSDSRVCLFEDNNLGGCLFEKNGEDSDFQGNDPCHFTFGDFNDTTSSYRNRENERTVLCHNQNWLGGQVAVMNANSSANSLGTNNDAATSLSYNGNEDCVN